MRGPLSGEPARECKGRVVAARLARDLECPWGGEECRFDALDILRPINEFRGNHTLDGEPID